MPANSRTFKEDSLTTYFIVYAAILAIAGLQVYLAYRTADMWQHITWMLSLAFVQAALAVLVFMHLMHERLVMIIGLIPFTLFVLMMMNMIWSDSFRILKFSPFH